MRTYRIDIDGTIAIPCFFHQDFEQCQRWYVQAGIVKQEELISLQIHQHLFLLPHVLLTHRAIEGAVQALQRIVREGMTLGYCTLRQHRDPIICERVHRNTCIWLEQQQFPCPMEAKFFWHMADKLLTSLDAPEEEVILIDDRPAGLVKAYETIVQSHPERAQQIQQRVTIMAFGCAETTAFPHTDLRVIPLENWSCFRAW
jgi:hypothetical protein